MRKKWRAHAHAHAHSHSHQHPRAPALQVGEAEKELGGLQGENPYVRLVDEAEGLDKIEQLQVCAVGWVDVLYVCVCV